MGFEGLQLSRGAEEPAEVGSWVGKELPTGEGAMGVVEGTTSQASKGSQASCPLPSSGAMNGTRSKVRLTHILGINSLSLSGYSMFQTLKGLKQLPRDFPITQVTWVDALCEKTWEINKNPK